MTENEYQNELLKWFSANQQHSCYIDKLPMRYEIGKYRKGKVMGMPDCELDIVSVDENQNFHLWELKKLDSNELNTGKFFGQLMLYDFLFSSEPWNELHGRICMRVESSAQIVGDIGKVYGSILGRANNENTDYDNDGNVIDGKATCSFDTWKLVVCGGKGYELAAGYNPIIWSFWTFQETYLNETTPRLEIYHFYNGQNNFQLRELSTLSLDKPDGLCEAARDAFETDHPDWNDT